MVEIIRRGTKHDDGDWECETVCTNCQSMLLVKKREVAEREMGHGALASGVICPVCDAWVVCLGPFKPPAGAYKRPAQPWVDWPPNRDITMHSSHERTDVHNHPDMTRQGGE